ncbi:uncharacterized protein LOC123313435 [Coccinella septempunctata]|uniref:uncharacterized protein LOC123313435 n=1 Tax=Coccinella septempunctata TaxID=41139 RepID=UPI001D06D851|nr:uncharacterized protein LOC123313435 [Coccinella septempunctata]
MEYKKIENSTPSSGKNRLVEKVRNSNINCDSPFRLLPNISTPPSRMFTVRNPFESPLLERLHLPVCSPGLFAKSTPKKEEKFIWSICDISNLKPAEIDTNCYQENTCTKLDPQKESLIQDKISTFFRHNAIVPSPAPRENERKLVAFSSDLDCHEVKKESTVNKKLLEGPHVIGFNNSAMDISNASEDKEQYLPEDVYYKKLFDFECETPKPSPLISLLDSPVQFSPPEELKVKSFSDEMDKKVFKECGLSPITPENEMSHRDSSKNSTRELKSVCRLVFSEKGSDHEKDLEKSFDFEGNENTVKESGLASDDFSYGNSGIMSIDEVYPDSDNEKMDISLSNTPKTGIFSSQRKRLSDSFKDFHSSFSQSEELREHNTNDIPTKSEGSSDMGYYSENIAPSMSEKTWNNSHVFSSTPTKRKK